MTKKTILHIDGDAFFVGVEVAKNPKLKGRPVVTGEDRGIVSALSYEAKALGIVRGMPIFRVKKDFPKVLILPGDYESYARYSSLMFDIVRRYADDVEEYSIDECFADLTGLEPPLKMSYRQIAERIKKEVNDELKLSVSLGVASTKVLAKVASKWVKPNGLTVIEPGKERDFLIKTSVEKIWGIGPKTSIFLKKRGIETAEDFVAKGISWVRQQLSKPYEAIWQELSGISVMEIDARPKTVYSSIQKTRTFHPPTNDRVFLLSQLSKNMEEACAKARHYKLVPKKISIFLKTQNFKYSVCDIILQSPTNAPEVLISLVDERFEKIHSKSVIYRTTGVTLRDLQSGSVSQGDLFGDRAKADRFELIHKQIDLLENKFGKKMVYLASTHKALKRKKIGTDSDDLDRDLLFL
ncbi:MAG: DNA polymerase IV [Candidatus Taylorbacteria bacterium]|nr:DNA polymerase IV [Candidatus Taylorbacteria bacterium]